MKAQIFSDNYVNPLSTQMVKHTQMILRQIVDELFDHFAGLVLKGLRHKGYPENVKILCN